MRSSRGSTRSAERVRFNLSASCNGAIDAAARVRDAGPGGHRAGHPGRLGGHRAGRPGHRGGHRGARDPGRGDGVRSPLSLNSPIFMLLSSRLGGPLRPLRSTPGLGSGRCRAAHRLICAPPSRTAPPRCSPRPAPRPHCQAPATPRSPRCPPRRAGSRGPFQRAQLTDLTVVGIAQLCGLDRAVISLRHHHQVKHPNGVAVDQRLQLGCHLAREVRLVRRESDDQIVDRPELINVDVRHVLLRSVAPSIRADHGPARRATRVVVTSSREFSGV